MAVHTVTQSQDLSLVLGGKSNKPLKPIKKVIEPWLMTHNKIILLESIV